MGLLSPRRGGSSSPSPSASSSPVPSTPVSTKNAVKTTLVLLEKAAEASSLPILKGAVGTVLEVVKIVEKRAQNKESLEELVKHLRRLEDAMIKPLLSKQSLGVPADLEARVRRFTEELVTIANDWKTLRASHRRILSFMNHEDYTAEIGRLNNLIRDSLAAFSLENQIAATIVGESTHHATLRVEQHLLSKEIQGLRRARAAYDSSSRSNAPKCFQGTRTLVFDLLRKWIADKAGPRTCVLEGIAGVGKTTIAQTLAIEEAEINRLAASFIFSRYENDRNNAELFFTTLTYQLAQCNKEFADRINMALKQSPDAPEKTFAEQLKKLIVEPLQDLLPSTSYPNLIILDALDECENEGATQIFNLLLNQLPFFKILITTRPEPHLRAILSSHRAHESLVLHEVDNMVVDSDIRRYLEHQLTKEEIQKVVPECEWQLTEEDLDALVKAAGRLFIVASTAEKFIKHPIQADPQHQLRVLLDAFSNKRNDEGVDLSPYTTLDRLYDQILDTAMPIGDSSRSIIERFQTVVGLIIVMQDPLPPSSIATLLGLNISSVNAVLGRLKSVIVSSSTNGSPHVYHPSFPDFITTPTRCKQARFLIVPEKHHNRMTTHCFDLMGRLLRRNICDIPIPNQYLENINIPDLPEKVAEHIPTELIYACSYWAAHLSKARFEVAELVAQLETFAFRHLLFWIEVLSLTDNLRLGGTALILAHEFATLHGGSAKLLSMLYDGQRFILSSQDITKMSALHIYYSALPFIPSETILFETYKSQISHSIRALRGQAMGWDPLLAILAGHSDWVRCAAFTSDGNRLASGSDDRTIRMWDGATGVHIATLEGHSGWICSVAFSPDGRRLASGSDDMTIKLWDGVTAAHITTLVGHSGRIKSVTFTSDGKRLASGSDDKTIRIWDGTTGVHIRTMAGHSEGVWCVAFSPDGRRLASGSADNTIRLWSSATGVHLTTMRGHSDEVKSIAFSPDGKRLVSGSNDTTIRLWESATGVRIATLTGHSGYVWSVASTSDGTRFASGSKDQTIRLWDGATGKHIVTLEGHSDEVYSVAFTPDGKRLASGSGDNTLRLWDGTTGAHLPALEGHSDGITCITFAPDGKRLASGSQDHTIRLWDAITGAHAVMLEGHSKRVWCLKFAPDGKRLASGSHDATVRLWDVVTGVHVATLEGHSKEVNAIAFTSDGKRLASASDDGTVRLWDGITAAHIATLKGHSSRVWCVAFTPDGERLASGSLDETIRLWDGSTGAHIATLNGHSDNVIFVAFSPDGSHLISKSPGGETKQWNVATGVEVTTPQARSSQLDHSLSSTTALLHSAPSIFSRAKRNKFSAIVAKPSQTSIFPVCFLPLDYSINESTSIGSRIALGMENGQVSILDASQLVLE